MPVPADQLRAIKTFPDLARYLEDALDWPLQEYGFDELTFEYSPADLGLRDEDAAKVKAIYQLRPLAHGQPFGVFFAEFERKRMPVVVLRRILSHLVLRKRASANRADALTGGWKPQQPAQSLPAQAKSQSAQADFAMVAATSSRPEPALGRGYRALSAGGRCAQRDDPPHGGD